MKAYALDRDDVKQAMKVIMTVSKEAAQGRNFLIFAEGTRSRDNQLLEFKGGSFKAAIKARCPIVPIALIDSYKSFDTNSIKPLTVTVAVYKSQTRIELGFNWFSLRKNANSDNKIQPR